MKAMEDYKPSILLNTIKAKQIMHSIPVNMQVRVQSIRYAKELFIESFRGNKGGWSQQIISDRWGFQELDVSDRPGSIGGKLQPPFGV
jgi:hypothetical protein